MPAQNLVYSESEIKALIIADAANRGHLVGANDITLRQEAKQLTAVMSSVNPYYFMAVVYLRDAKEA